MLRHGDQAEDDQDAADSLLLNVLHSPVTRDREQRRKSSSVLLKPPIHLANRRLSARSILDEQFPFIDAQNAATVDDDELDDGDEEDAPTLDVSPRYVRLSPSFPFSIS